MDLTLSLILCPLGPGYDLTFSEVRDSSMLVEWKKPVYTGSGSITGYHVEYAKKGTSDWTTANETAASHRFLKVRASLEMIHWYIFEVFTSMIIYLKYFSYSMSEHCNLTLKLSRDETVEQLIIYY